MKKSNIVWIGIAFVVLVLFVWIYNSYNTMVTTSQAVDQQWGQVNASYQRRADLIPNLVNTVKGYSQHEKNTLEDVTNARAKATQMNITVDNLTPENIAKYQQAQGELSQALGRLLAVTENYPDLKANTNFLALQTQLEGTENRINTERKRFNDAVNQYNVSILRFPGNLLAGMFGFTKKGYFEANAGAENAPKVEF